MPPSMTFLPPATSYKAMLASQLTAEVLALRRENAVLHSQLQAFDLRSVTTASEAREMASRLRSIADRGDELAMLLDAVCVARRSGRHVGL